MRKIEILFYTLLLCSTQFLQAQTRLITGTVTAAEDGLTLPGVNVTVKGTVIGAITQLEGIYRIDVPQNATTLVFSFIGMKTQEVPIGDRTTINVVLETDAVGIEEVMVVAYSTVKRGDFTGSAQIVDGDRLLVPGAESLEKSLSGKVSGVRVSSISGDPGSSGEIQIRGIGSINGSTTPLYVIDGIPVESGNFGHYAKSSNIMSTINPEDILNLTVLKDAAAASLYGSRAANGVVIITTKKGVSGKTKFEFKANTGWASMATNSFELMTGPQYHRYEQLALENWAKGLYGLLPGQENYGNADTLATYQGDIDYYKSAYSSTVDSTVNTNWRDIIYRQAKQTEYQLSAAGGTEKTQFYIGGGYSDYEGIINGSSFNRFTGRMNLNHSANKWLKLSLNEMLSFTNQKGYQDQTNQAQGIGSASPLGVLLEANPTAPKYDENGNRYDQAMFGYMGHPEDFIDGKSQFVDSKTYRSLTNGSAQVNFTPDLSFKSTLGIDWVQAQNLNYWSPTSWDGQAVNGLGERDLYTITDLTSSNILTYNKTFNDVHNFSAILGFESNSVQQAYLQATATNYSNSKLPELASGQANSVTSEISTGTLLSYFGSLNYIFSEKYYLTGSLRSDGSSRLGIDNRWANFWSASAAWRFGKESFLENSSLITDGKIRFSYGTNGNLPPNYYTHMALYNFSGGYGENSAIFVDNPGNAKLGWEKSNNMNLGLDLTIFKRFGFVVEYYKKLTEDLLLNVPISYLTGFGDTWKNTGSIKNNGVEVEFHSVNIASPSGFKWRTDFTLTTQKSVVVSLPNNEDIIAGDGNLYKYSVNKDLYSFYLPTWVGVDSQTGYGYFLRDPALPDSPENRVRRYADAQRSIVAKAYPDFIGGMNNSISFKGFQLDFLFTYSFGGNLFDYPGYFMHHDGFRCGIFNLAKDVEGNYWTKPGDVVDNPMPNYDDSNRPDRWSTRFIKSTDFVRLKEITLGYDLPSAFVKKMSVENIKIYAKGTNAWLWSKTKGIDPEVTLNGYRTVDTPLSKIWTIGANLSF
jgi:TonB-linked SusC/RagA family outer membrane protein